MAHLFRDDCFWHIADHFSRLAECLLSGVKADAFSGSPICPLMTLSCYQQALWRHWAGEVGMTVCLSHLASGFHRCRAVAFGQLDRYAAQTRGFAHRERDGDRLCAGCPARHSMLEPSCRRARFRNCCEAISRRTSRQRFRCRRLAALCSSTLLI
jgi:hypothetical protein